ncbi:flagellar biosynthesis protein FlgA [Xylanimonas oleitrophica]|uniref:Flagellar biosynthesis protein FlgA n=1 Tax=Xylanimonas oleitrophica TaxID=2607479 RepID=A0A2W5WRR0_9MICO|nr:SAF domain-containing protein [Xylanimonas oleitrophica]PZR54199.1 flagellar biosynthesis protein FlgA [Xylanimonas oleitrophica]
MWPRRDTPPAPPTGTTGTSPHRHGRALRRLLWRSRFAVVALCCGIAATSTVEALRPEPLPVRDVVVPTHRLAPGAQVAHGDIEVRQLPATLVPADVLSDPADAVGRVPAVPIEAGMPLSAALVAGGDVVAQAPAGTVVVPVRLDAAATALLRPGDRVDLVTTAAHVVGPDDDASGHAYLARRALVLPGATRTAPDAGGSGGLLAGPAASSGPAPVTLVAVAPDDAPALSAASGSGTVAAVLVP